MPSIDLFAAGGPTFNHVGSTLPSSPTKATKGGLGAGLKGSNIVHFNNAWQRRTVQLMRAGYNTHQIQSVQKYDQSLIQNGGKGLTDLQTYVAAHAIATGNQTAAKPPEHHGIFGFVGNTFDDIGNIVTNIIPNTASFIYHLPSETRDEYRAWTDEAWRKKHGFETGGHGILSDLAAAARNLTKHPLVQLLPGIHTLAGLTTEKGRAQLWEHPVSTTIDIASFVAPMAKAAAVSRGLEAGVDLGRSASFGKTMGIVGEEGSRATSFAERIGEGLGPFKGLNPVKPGSAGEAFAAGNIYKGMFRLVGENEWANRLVGGDAAHPLSQMGQILDVASKTATLKNPLTGEVGPVSRVFPRTSEAVARAAERAPLGGLGKSQREYVTRISSQMSRKLGMETSKTWKQVSSIIDPLPASHKQALLDALRLETDDPAKAAEIVAAMPNDSRMAYQAMADLANKWSTEEAFQVTADHLDPGMTVAKTARKNMQEGKRVLGITHEEASKAAPLAGKEMVEIPHGNEVWYYTTTDNVAKKYLYWQGHVARVAKAQQALTELTHTSPTAEAVAKATARVERATKAADASGADFYNTFSQRAPRVMHGPIMARVMKKSEAWIREQDAKAKEAGAIPNGQRAAGDPTLVANTVAERLSALYNNDLKRAGLPEKEWNSFVKEAQKDWLDLAHAGVRPIFIPNVSEGTMASRLHATAVDEIKIDGLFKDASIKNWKPSVADLKLAFTYHGTAVLREQASRSIIESKLDNFGHTFDESVQFELHRLSPKEAAGKSLAEQMALAEEKVRTQYHAYNKITQGRLTNLKSPYLANRSNIVFVHQAIDKSFDKSYGEFVKDKNFLTGAYDKSTKLFRFAVTTSPRHVAHVFFSGMMAAGAEQGWRPFTHLGTAWKAVKNDEEMMQLYDLGQAFEHPEMVAGLSGDQIRSGLHGNILGHALGQVVGKAEKGNAWLRTQEERIGNMWRVSSFLTEKEDLISHGMSEELASAHAVEMANYIHLDFDGMAPFERTIQRSLVPFLSFERQIFRYILRYPADHPLRAAILTRMANMQSADWRSGLPGVFAEYLPIGSLSGGGDLTVLPVQTINPFRSLGEGRNPFEVTGLLSNLNPAVRSLAEVLGINTLTSNIDRTMTQHVDPFYGTLVDDKKPWIQTLLHQYVPQSDLLTQWLGWQPALNYLRQTDPTGAYHHALASIAGIPFVPFKINVYQKRLKYQLAYYKQAQQDVSAAMRSGNTSSLQGYDQVPFHGQLVPSDRIVQLIEQARKINPNVPPSSVIPSTYKVPGV